MECSLVFLFRSSYDASSNLCLFAKWYVSIQWKHGTENHSIETHVLLPLNPDWMMISINSPVKSYQSYSIIPYFFPSISISSKLFNQWNPEQLTHPSEPRNGMEIAAHLPNGPRVPVVSNVLSGGEAQGMKFVVQKSKQLNMDQQV